MRRARLIGPAAALAAALAVVAPAPASADAPIVDCSTGAGTICKYETPGGYTWTVPEGVHKVTFIAYGGEGGPSLIYDTTTVRFPGGLGGEASASFDVTPGQVFQLAVGGMGGGGPVVTHSDGGGVLTKGCQGAAGNFHPGFGGNGFGGCGGGGSFVVTKLGDDPFGRIMLAAGGGGGGGGGGKGGQGGGIAGSALPLNGLGPAAGGGASSTAPGTGGPSSGPNSGKGFAGFPYATSYASDGFEFSAGGSGGGGGDPNNFQAIFYAGGTGGSGYYGGGGGGGCTTAEPACDNGGGGGGGGSAYAEPSATAVTGFDGGSTGGGDGSIEVLYGQSSGGGGGGGSGGGGGGGSGGGGTGGGGSGGSGGGHKSTVKGKVSLKGKPAPNNAGGVRLAVVVSGPGKLNLRATASVPARPASAATRKPKRKTIVVATRRVSVKKAGRVSVLLTPSKAAKKLLAHGHTLRVTIAVTFTPKGGNAVTKRTQAKLRLVVHKRKKHAHH